jgi:hypothetical protein
MRSLLRVVESATHTERVPGQTGCRVFGDRADLSDSNQSQ